ncbi:MAG TPA: sigma-70 family RNA polymerase sigma factor [Chloroflexota bacterium]
MTERRELEYLMRDLAPQVLGTLVRRYGRFDVCEDAVQEALLAAVLQWPTEGVPKNPRGWLLSVASRRLIDELRREHARRRREEVVAELDPPDRRHGPAADEVEPDQDDTLILLFLCCHPSLTPASQIALALRAVGGLTTAEIAHAFLVPEATMAQRISRAKQTIKESGIPFAMPPESERDDRLRVVLHVLYLIFNEGYKATIGVDLQRTDLADEAIRIARMVHRLLPSNGETTGLLALMLLTNARRAARTTPDGGLILLADQDRALWDRNAITEGVDLISSALARGAVGPYQLQAAIAAVHAEAARAEDTDWRQILGLYELLERVSPSPILTLNRAVAVAMVRGPREGLELVSSLESEGRLAGHHLLEAVRARMLEMAGDHEAARNSYRLAARRTTSLPERRHLESRAARLAVDVESFSPASTTL